jgi:hypothetical protein
MPTHFSFFNRPRQWRRIKQRMWERIMVAGATIVLEAEQDANGRSVIRIAMMASLISQFGLFCVASSIRGVPTPQIDEDQITIYSRV